MDPRRGVVGDLLGTLEGKDAQLVLSYIVRPGEAPDPRFVEEWLRRCARCAPTDLDMTTPVKTVVLGGAGEQEASEADRLKADAISTEAQEVEEWEDEGGDTARAIAARLGSLEVSACYATRGVRMAARVDERVGCV